VQFWFTIFNGWSGQTFFERTTLTAYNIAWTLLPVVALGVFDKDLSEKYLLEHPQLYQIGIRHHYFNFKVFWAWFFNAIFHSIICFGFVAPVFMHSVPYSNGRAVDLFSIGITSFTCVVITVTLKLGLETRYWTWINHFVMWGSIIVYACWLMVYGVFFAGTSIGSDIYQVVFELYTTPLYYFTIIMVPIICLFRDLTWKFVQRTALPESYHIIQEQEMLEAMGNKVEGKSSAKKIYTGYSFSQDSSLGLGEGERTKEQYSPSANV